MQQTDWIILDTETTGIATPIYVVEVGAQKMRGWEPMGLPFRKLLNQNQDIPPEASRVHGYTREILERDGEPAAQVYEELRRYVCEETGDPIGLKRLLARPTTSFSIEAQERHESRQRIQGK